MSACAQQQQQCLRCICGVSSSSLSNSCRLEGEVLKAHGLIQERASEAQRATEAFAVLQTKLEAEVSVRRRLDADLARAQEEKRRAERERRKAEQLHDDLSRQVQALLEENQRVRLALRGGHSAGAAGALGSPLAPRIGSGTPGSPATAADVISQHLVEFRSIQDLQEQNRKLIAVSARARAVVLAAAVLTCPCGCRRRSGTCRTGTRRRRRRRTARWSAGSRRA